MLSSSERREVYDRFGHEGLRSGGFTPSFDFGSLSDLFSAFFGDDLFGVGARRARRGADIGAEIAIELVEAASGVTKRRAVPGRGAVRGLQRQRRRAGNEPRPVRRPAAGSGRLQQVSRSVFGEFIRTQTCPRCNGSGRVIESPCKKCRGGGRVARGAAARRPGAGRASTTASESASPARATPALPGGEAGDVYVLVHVASDPRFAREGDDIFSEVDLTMTEAALGTRFKVPTLDGDLELEFEQGTQPGEVHVLDGRGMPVLHSSGRGDHRILVNVVMPRRLTEEQRKLLGEFAASTDEETYAAENGFFQRLKSAFR